MTGASAPVFYMHNNFQYVIIGAGSAGLQLASLLLKAPKNLVGSILLLEKSPVHENKTWCFWDSIEHKYTGLVKKTWGSTQFSAAGFSKSENTGPVVYQYVESGDFYDFYMESFKSQERITVRYGVADRVSCEGEQCFVMLGDETICCEYIFCTDPTLLNRNDEVSDGVLQSFLGWQVTFESPVFNADCATMMDFEHSIAGETNFMYVLPFSPYEALVECTFFAESVKDEAIYKRQIETYITKKYGQDYQLVREERGLIPMRLLRDNQLPVNRIIPIGLAAGCIKASTGYSFTRNRRYAKHIYQQVLEEKEITAPKWKKRFLFYDSLFISILKHQPGVMQKILVQLFRKNKISLVLKFLDEDTNIFEEAIIFSTLPKWPFLKSLLFR